MTDGRVIAQQLLRIGARIEQPVGLEKRGVLAGSDERPESGGGILERLEIPGACECDVTELGGNRVVVVEEIRNGVYPDRVFERDYLLIALHADSGGELQIAHHFAWL